MKPLFSICIIVKNEANTLPKLFDSLKDFKKRKGEVCILDTGSADSTIEISKKWGAKVFESKFNKRIDLKLAKSINAKFLKKGEPIIVDEGNTLFDFAAARNFINAQASNDMICTLDADEAYTKFDIDKINSFIKEGFEQFEYQFVYAHDQNGNAAVQFVQSKFFNRTKAKWEGIVHEVVSGKTNLKYLDESIIKLEHFQEHGKDHRANYLPGLAFDCFHNPGKDRQSHYFARELMYTNRPKSAIEEFRHHITMGGWPAEIGQSMIYMARCYGLLNDPVNQAAWLSKAYYTDPGRRAALIELALFFRHQNNYHGAAAYAAAALQLPWVDYYANERAHYENLPHEILYWAKGWMGDIQGAQEHIIKAMNYCPWNRQYQEDTKYYFEYPDSKIEGWMRFDEVQFLYNESKKHRIIVEIGSWAGRSTHAICSGNKEGEVYAVDTWQGSADVQDATNWMSKQRDIFPIFKENTKEFKNLTAIRKSSLDGAKEFKDGSIDMCFIDAGHSYEEVKADIEAWLPKMNSNGILCGHDYVKETWMGVVQAVDEVFGEPDSVEGYSIWKVNLSKRGKTKPDIASRIEPHFKVVSINKKDKKSKAISIGNNIPKIIHTCWLSETAVMPPGIKQCIDSQKINGYTHRLWTLHDFSDGKIAPYLKKAIESKKWVKAADYIRMFVLYSHGGIFMDADTEIISGRNFDSLLNNEMFAGVEEDTLPEGVPGIPYVGYSIVGSRPNHRVAIEYLTQVERKFNGDDDFYFESSMQIFTELAYTAEPGEIKILPAEYFYPYSHKTGEIKVTDKTISFHHFLKSWKNETDLLPTVSIILPTLGREEGLRKCCKSIVGLYYPKHLIETLIIDGPGTVPEKIKMGVEKTSGDIIVYAANDMEFDPYSLYRAIKKTDKYSLVAFNTGALLPDNGNICEHFLIKRDFIDKIGGEIFDTRFHHVGVDNLLWERAVNLKQASRCKDAIVRHHHFSTDGKWDEVYEKGWSRKEEDRKLLKILMKDKSWQTK